jgi:2-haloacid dehalogenase
VTGTAAAPATVSFDVYGALIDSRSGGSRAFAGIAAGRGWRVDPGQLYDRWDRVNKQLQHGADAWIPYRELARRALARVYAELGLAGDADRDCAALLDTLGDWPAWPDVADGVAAVAALHRVALLSNIDDDLLARTRIGVAVPLAVTSEQARAYKPHPALYRHAAERLGSPLVHVPASARDTRGALEAGMTVVWVRRPGHELDPAGPRPRFAVDDLRELPAVLPAVLREVLA